MAKSTMEVSFLRISVRKRVTSDPTCPTADPRRPTFESTCPTAEWSCSDIRSEPRNLHVHPISLLADLLPRLLKQDIDLLHQFCLVRRATHYPEQTDHHRQSHIRPDESCGMCAARSSSGDSVAHFLTHAHSFIARKHNAYGQPRPPACTADRRHRPRPISQRFPSSNRAVPPGPPTKEIEDTLPLPDCFPYGRPQCVLFVHRRSSSCLEDADRLLLPPLRAATVCGF